MIPEWCKKAAEEISEWRKSDDTRQPKYIAAIVAKHAMEAPYQRSMIDGLNRAEKVRELVEAAREMVARIDERQLLFGANYVRLRRALEAFTEEQ